MREKASYGEDFTEHIKLRLQRGVFLFSAEVQNCKICIFENEMTQSDRPRHRRKEEKCKWLPQAYCTVWQEEDKVRQLRFGSGTT
jgi:hypothetical protein